jgi:hypothetical protein
MINFHRLLWVVANSRMFSLTLLPFLSCTQSPQYFLNCPRNFRLPLLFYFAPCSCILPYTNYTGFTKPSKTQITFNPVSFGNGTCPPHTQINLVYLIWFYWVNLIKLFVFIIISVRVFRTIREIWFMKNITLHCNVMLRAVWKYP